MEEKLIQVLWVEDDPGCIRDYPIEAARYGLKLIPFSCWEDAREALTKDFSQWVAIILDAKCKKSRDSHDNAVQFLGQALSDISRICTDRHRIVPWFVLSGGSEDEVNDSIIDDRLEWDSDWPKKYYSKTVDRGILFHRILHKAKLSTELQVRLLRYRDVFKAIDRIGLDPDFEGYMLDLLEPLHSFKTSPAEYNHRMTLVRKCIELIFHSMAQHGILPNEKTETGYKMHHLLCDRRGGINTTWCSKLLSGMEVRNPKTEKTVFTSTNILPRVLKESFQRLIEIASAKEHAENPNPTAQQEENTRHTEEFLQFIDQAPYLLASMTMELCCILKWYESYLRIHDDEERNALEWKVADNATSQNN